MNFGAKNFYETAAYKSQHIRPSNANIFEQAIQYIYLSSDGKTTLSVIQFSYPQIDTNYPNEVEMAVGVPQRPDPPRMTFGAILSSPRERALIGGDQLIPTSSPDAISARK